MGFYIDGVRVNPETYVLYDELNKTRQRLNALGEEIRESNMALLDSLQRDEPTAKMGAELAELRQTLQDVTEQMRELGRLMIEKQRLDQRLDNTETGLKQIRLEMQELRRIMVHSIPGSNVDQAKADTYN